MRHVILIVGPPCAGKTTWVRQHAGPNDLIIDWDALAQQAGSPTTHDHAQHYADAASIQRNRLEQHVSLMTDGTAYVIRTLPNPRDRDRVAKRLKATTIKTIAPDPDIVQARAHTAHRRPEIFQAINDWYKHNPHRP